MIQPSAPRRRRGLRAPQSPHSIRRSARAAFTCRSGHPIYRGTCSLGKNRCPAIWRLFSSGCSAAWSHRRAHTRSWRRRRDRQVRAIRRSAACPLVPPIPAYSATPAASATRRGFRRLVETRRCRQLITDPSVLHLHAWQRPTRARRSASSAQIRWTQEGRRSVGAVGHRSESLPGFAGAVSANSTDARGKQAGVTPAGGLFVKVPFRPRH